MRTPHIFLLLIKHVFCLQTLMFSVQICIYDEEHLHSQRGVGPPDQWSLPVVRNFDTVTSWQSLASNSSLNYYTSIRMPYRIGSSRQLFHHWRHEWTTANSHKRNKNKIFVFVPLNVGMPLSPVPIKKNCSPAFVILLLYTFQVLFLLIPAPLPQASFSLFD